MKQAQLTDDWAASATESHSTHAQSNEDNASDERRPTTKAALCERAATHASESAAEHFPDLPVAAINWETSTRMQRSAGVAIYDQQSEQITIRLSWDAYEAYGWEQFSRVVRHELIHAWQYHEYSEADHGSTFKQWVEPLETDRHCEQYAGRTTGLSLKSVKVVIPDIADRRLLNNPRSIHVDGVVVRSRLKKRSAVTRSHPQRNPGPQETLDVP